MLRLQRARRGSPRTRYFPAVRVYWSLNELEALVGDLKYYAHPAVCSDRSLLLLPEDETASLMPGFLASVYAFAGECRRRGIMARHARDTCARIADGADRRETMA